MADHGSDPLVGQIRGVDFRVKPKDPNETWSEDANTMTFVLDGKAYLVMEDYNDGYRSSMRDIVEVTGVDIKNTFEPVRVLAVYCEKCDYGGAADILKLIDVITGKTVLEAGTDNSDDYYPSFVANFTPENMSVNARVEGDR